MKQYNFYAGPSILHPDIIQQALAEIEAKDGLSILESSHRGSEVQFLFDYTKNKLKDLMQLDDKYEVLFLHGGARLQNCMVPYNVKTKEAASYIDTGVWSKKSFEESSIIRPSQILASSSSEKYSCIPKDFNWDGKGYLHITTNNTIHGTQFHEFEFTKQGVVVADMSSDILSRKLDYNQFGLIYAGLQKNLGTAGGTLLVIDKNLLEDLPKVPRMLNYKIHVDANSMFNTPPVFAVLMCRIVLDWMEKKGGISVIAEENNQKASLLYEALDELEHFTGFAKKEDRSLMNVTFNLKDDAIKSQFNEALDKSGIIGLNGHRSKGGYRASLYNQLPMTHVEQLVKVMRNFA